jgi:translocation protein SEC63
LQEHGEVNAFDPYVILELDSGSEMKAVKKAFRTMSLIWHPDKNKNNPAAEAKFMLINKAYEALTDPVAKENWEKYGNPDGKQSMAVSIGLPSWLLDTNNRNLVLMSYLLIMVVIIPWVVYNYYSSSSKFGEKDVMYDTYSWFHHTLNEHTILKSLPEILAGSAEFRQMNMPKTKQDKEDVGVVMNAVRTQMQKPKFNHPVCVKGNVMLHAHLLRKTDLLSDNLKPNLYEMLKKSNALIEAMLAVCQHEDWLQTALNCIQFGQHIAQACWLKDSSLLQLPHFTDKEVKHCATGKQSLQAKNITQYLKIPDENKKGLADFTDEQKNDVLKSLWFVT